MIGSSIFYRKFLKLDLMVVMEFDQCPRAWPQRSKTIVSYFFVNVFFSWLQLDQSSQSQEIGEFFDELQNVDRILTSKVFMFGYPS